MRWWHRFGFLVNILGVCVWFFGTAVWVLAAGLVAGSENARLVGIPSKYISVTGAACASIASGVLLASWYLENRRVHRLLDPRRTKIRRLEATIRPVERFFEGRDCEGHPDECARVLGLYMQDARDSGLFDAPEFVDERVAMRQDDNPFANFKHVASMMRYKRNVTWTADWQTDLREFQAWLLEAIRREIEIERARL